MERIRTEEFNMYIYIYVETGEGHGGFLRRQGKEKLHGFDHRFLWF